MAAPTPSLSLSMDSILRPSIPTTTLVPSLHKPLPSRFKFFRPLKSGPFLDATGIQRLETLTNFRFSHEFDHGFLEIRPMEQEELNSTSMLLAESFAQYLWMPAGYTVFLAFLVKQYVLERRLLIPHTAVMVGFYREKGGGDAEMACTAEISFDALGANASTPTPMPPRVCPYICNMTVRKSLRRRGIGWQLLKACEELISQMKTSRKVYLHCRVIDTGPFNMYTKAGYKVVETDTILVWLSLQRRKYLMFKELPILDNHRSDASDS